MSEREDQARPPHTHDWLKRAAEEQLLTDACGQAEPERIQSAKIKPVQEFEHLSPKRREWREEKNDDRGCNGNRQAESDAPPNLCGNRLAVEHDRKECLSAECSVDKCRERDCDRTCGQKTANTDQGFCRGLVHLEARRLCLTNEMTGAHCFWVRPEARWKNWCTPLERRYWRLTRAPSACSRARAFATKARKLLLCHGRGRQASLAALHGGGSERPADDELPDELGAPIADGSRITHGSHKEARCRVEHPQGRGAIGTGGLDLELVLAHRVLRFCNGNRVKAFEDRHSSADRSSLEGTGHRDRGIGRNSQGAEREGCGRGAGRHRNAGRQRDHGGVLAR